MFLVHSCIVFLRHSEHLSREQCLNQYTQVESWVNSSYLNNDQKTTMKSSQLFKRCALWPAAFHDENCRISDCVSSKSCLPHQWRYNCSNMRLCPRALSESTRSQHRIVWWLLSSTSRLSLCQTVWFHSASELDSTERLWQERTKQPFVLIG